MYLQKDIRWFITQIPSPNDSNFFNLYFKYQKRIEEAPGSATKHQNWPGGWINHVEMMLNMADVTYDAWKQMFRLKFKLEDTYLPILLHDLEKVFVYTEPKLKFDNDELKLNFILKICGEYKISLSDEQKNCLKYIHGEDKDYNPITRIMMPLTVFCHALDFQSARGWYDEPKNR